MLIELLLAAMLSLGLLVAQDAPATTRPDDPAASLVGTWKAESAVMAGQTMPAEMIAAITLTMEPGDGELLDYTLDLGGAEDRGTIALDAGADPMAMTITGTGGPNDGKMFPAIFEIDGDTLRICYDLSEQERPAEFESRPGTMQFLATYRRAAPTTRP